MRAGGLTSLHLAMVSIFATGMMGKIGTGFIVFLSLQIPWLSMTFSSFQWPSVLLSLSKTLKTILALGQFLTWFIVQQMTLWRPPKWVPFELLNYLSLSYFVLVLTSPVTNLTNTTLIFHDFLWPTIINFHDFQDHENEILKFQDSSSFPWPVRTLRYFCACLDSFCPGLQLEEMKHLIKLFIHSFLCFAWIFFLT